MKFKILSLAFIGLLTAVPAFSQRARTVTNTDLEKYRQKRLSAEKEYNDNYARLGFPSPEELQKRLEKDRIEREALSARLAAERIQQEQAEAAARAAAARQAETNVLLLNGGGGYYYGFPNYYNGRSFPYTRQYGLPNRVGNGIPIVNYYGFPGVRHFQPPIGMGRR